MERISLRLSDQRDLGPDAMATRAVAIQVRRAARLLPAAHPGRVRVDQEHLHDAHRCRARAQGEGRDMTAEALIGLIMLLVLLGAIFIGVLISFTLLFLAFLRRSACCLRRCAARSSSWSS